MELQNPFEAKPVEVKKISASEEDAQDVRRKFPRFEFARKADWDFFTYATGAKLGYIENVSRGGCLLRTTEPIEHRRWIRIVVKEAHQNLWFTCVGRVLRREDKMESWDDDAVTLHRYGIEFIHSLNPLILDRVQEISALCDDCGSRSAAIPDPNDGQTMYCVLCHLRRACHNLLVHDQLPSA